MAKTANPQDILRLGAQNAAIKANLPKKKWAAFVRLAHARGHTIGGELSDSPTALKERTAASLKSEAAKSVATAYAPAAKEITSREAAIGFLNDKRAADDQSYRTWLLGETGKLNAQAKAADTTIAAQQSTIADETKSAVGAARADTLQRVQGSLSDPTQSKALDTSAADAATAQHVGTARTQTAELSRIGGDSRALADASLLSQQTAVSAAHQGDTWKALADAHTDRQKLAADQAAATLTKTGDLIDKNATIVAANRDADLAGASLNLKKDDLANSITQATRKYNLETAKFGLDKWKADNAATVAQAKNDLGYAQIVSKEGIASAKRKLDTKLAQIRAAQGNKKPPSKGVTTQERTLYGQVQKAVALFNRWDGNNAVPLAERDQKLRDSGAPEGVIELAHDLARNHGVMTAAMRVKARQLGLVHSAYFYPVAPGAEATPPGGNLGR